MNRRRDQCSSRLSHSLTDQSDDEYCPVLIPVSDMGAVGFFPGGGTANGRRP